MKEYKKNYKGVEEDYSGKALFIFFLIGISIITIATVVLLNL